MSDIIGAWASAVIHLAMAIVVIAVWASEASRMIDQEESE